MKCSLSNSDGSHKDLLVSIRVNKPVEMMSSSIGNSEREYIARPKLVKTRDTEKKSED